jgi:23S rRNA (guanosine2251-2'-O)-methyltransferase
MTEKNDYTIYGIHAIEEALQSGKVIQKLIVAKGNKHAAIDALINHARKAGAVVQLVPREASVFPAQKNHQGVVAHISPVEYYELEQLLPQLFERGVEPFIMVLDRITDVRNFGAIARTALCSGAHAIVITQSGSVSVTDDAIKASAGALLQLPVCRERNLKTTMELLNQSGVKTVGMTEKANKELPFADLTGPLALIMGSEKDGLSNDVLRRCTQLVKIPMPGSFDSLNVSVAAGIGLYEAVRQRMTE